jgi:hypothetical protein
MAPVLGEADHPPSQLACRGALQLVLALKVADELHSLHKVSEQGIELASSGHRPFSR